MSQSNLEDSNLNQKLYHSKKIMIALSISLVVFSAILLPLGFFYNQNIHLFGWIPLASLIVIVLDIFIFRHLILRNRLKIEQKKYLERRKKITAFLLILLVLTFLYDFIITIIKSTEIYLFQDNYFYGYICGIILFGLILFINSTEFSTIQIDIIVAGLLLLIYAILISPQILSKFSLQIYPYLPMNLLLRSFLSIGLTMAYFTFQRMKNTKILSLMLIYTWIFIPFQIINWFGFTNYYPFVVTMNLFHDNPVLMKMIQTSSIIIASCLLMLIIVVSIFVFNLFSKNTKIKSINLKQ